MEVQSLSLSSLTIQLLLHITGLDTHLLTQVFPKIHFSFLLKVIQLQLYHVVDTTTSRQLQRESCSYLCKLKFKFKFELSFELTKGRSLNLLFPV